MVHATMWKVVFSLLVLADFTICKNHKVSVDLQARWPDTSILAETSEFLADQSPELFWRFLDRLDVLVRSNQQRISGSSKFAFDQLDRETFNHLETILAGLTSEDVANFGVLRLFLSSRFYSAAVEMNHQVALTVASQLLNTSRQTTENQLFECVVGSTWAHVGDRLVCQFNELHSALNSLNASHIPFAPLERDHTFPTTMTRTDIPTVTLYGDLGVEDFYKWHKQLKSWAEDNTCRYVFRHYIKNRPAEKPLLSGYGVELALKSTEYKAMDDSKVEDSSSADNESSDDAIVQGFNFTQLNAQHPNLSNELKEFQKHLLVTDNELRPLKAWQFRELGLQASQAVVDAATTEFPDPDGNATSAVDPGLLALRDVSQNFPARTSRLVSSTVRTSLKDEVATNHYRLSTNAISPGQTAFFINGISVSPNVDIFALLELVREEQQTMASLQNLGIPVDQITDLMITADLARESGPQIGDGSVPGLRYSLSRRFALDISKSPISYINNLESDPAYAYWSDSLLAVLTDPSGGIRRIRRNLYNVIVVLDPTSAQSRNWTQLVSVFLRHKTAIRFGILWSLDPTEYSTSLVLARIFNYLSTTISHASESPLSSSLPGLGSPGAVAGLSFLSEVFAEADQLDKELTVEFVQSRFEKFFPNADAEDIITPAPGESDYDTDIKSHQKFLVQSGLASLPNKPLLLFNGLVFDSHGIDRMGGFEDAVVTLCMEEMIRIQHAIFQGQLMDTSTIFDLYKRAGSIVSRYNHRLLDSTVANYVNFGQNKQHAPLANAAGKPLDVLKNFSDHMRYFQKGDVESALRPLTIWVVVGNLDSIFEQSSFSAELRNEFSRDLSLARAAISYIRSAQSSKSVRIGFVFNPSSESPTSQHWLMRALHLVGHPVRPPLLQDALLTNETIKLGKKLVEQLAAKNFANRLLAEANDLLDTKRANFRLSDVTVSGVDVDTLQSALDGLDQAAFIREHSFVSRHILGLRPGERAVVVNGKIIGPLQPDEEFTLDDFRLAEKLALSSGVEKLGTALTKLLGDELNEPEAISELTWRVASVLRPPKGMSSHSVTDLDATEGILNRKRVKLSNILLEHSGFQIPGPSGVPVFDILAVVNPCSREAQRLSHLLIVLQQALPCRFRVSMNPLNALSELPVKNFYRFVWEPSLFSPNSSSRVQPRALFTHLPGQPLLTLGMDAPHGWMVAAVKAVHDLDNLRLSDVHSTVEAVFELEHLLLEGHCFEGSSMKPPRGLQLTLGPTSDSVAYDTIVMANLGYFQLKSSPGSWHLAIRAGRSRDIYTLSNEDQDGTVLNAHDMLVSMDSLRSKIITMYVSKRPERMNENLLGDIGSSSSVSTSDSWAWLYKNSAVWSTLSDYAETLCPSWLTSLRKSLQKHLPWQRCEHKHQTINVFSLASGHMYERLLRIMMLTVLRHTKSPVKFWFLKNYLSPTFKDFIPHMAAEYGFEYELVQYQWPRWLHAQTEKQRIIWGYKILFLDVLFPLNVTKIIFVDADQIVRADLQELADLDLGGAPYGYTPFCDSRTEMDGFRFWKQGYWASHLAGRPYHISALYVVDLVRFRQLAAGDRLRGQYHGLSQDPQSLSNLDQDLPNNMIHQVPIKSLPQEWLWCETWCSDESKAKAKTIDLCNNPMTKEPKLSAAMRIAPEWVDYDREIKKFWQRVYPPPPKPEPKPQDSSSLDKPQGTGEQCTSDCASKPNPLTPGPTTSAPFTPKSKQEL